MIEVLFAILFAVIIGSVGAGLAFFFTSLLDDYTQHARSIAIAVLGAAALGAWFWGDDMRTERDHARDQLGATEEVLRTLQPFTYEQEQRLARAERRLERRQREMSEFLYGD